MESKKNASTGLLVLTLLLTTLGLVLTLVQLLNGTAIVFRAIVSFIVFALIYFYTLYGYRLPHGNLMRYTMLLFAVLLGLMFNSAFMSEFVRGAIIVCVALIAFMSGRLHKQQDCKTIILIVFLILLGDGLLSLILTTPEYLDIVGRDFWSIGVAFVPVITWAALSMSYWVRFRDHREAGEE